MRAQVEEKNNLVEFFQKEIAKIQQVCGTYRDGREITEIRNWAIRHRKLQVFAKVLDWDKAKRKKKSQLQGVDGAVDEEELVSRQRRFMARA